MAPKYKTCSTGGLVKVVWESRWGVGSMEVGCEGRWLWWPLDGEYGLLSVTTVAPALKLQCGSSLEQVGASLGIQSQHTETQHHPYHQDLLSEI